MKNRIRKKLRSEKGASITFALLLFLVCSVVGGVVLAAGTAAGGRIASMARMDQKYYSVASAVQMLSKKLDGKTVKIVRTEEKISEKRTTGGHVSTDNQKSYSTALGTGDASLPFTLRNPEPGSSYLEGGSAFSPRLNEMSFLTEQAASLMFWDDVTKSFNNCNTADAMGYSFSRGTGQVPIRETNFTITLKKSSGGGNTTEQEDLAVAGVCKLMADGTLLIEVGDAMKLGASDDPYHYTLQLTLSPSIRETESKTVTGGDVPVVTTDASGEIVETVTTRETRTKTSEITWTVSNIQKKES